MANKNLRLPENTRKIRGTFRKDRKSTDLSTVNDSQIVKIPKLPAGKWPLITRKIHSDVCDFILKNNLANTANLVLIAIIAIELGKYHEICEMMADLDPLHPDYKILSRLKNQSLENGLKVANLFGITPAGAKSLALGEKQEEEPEGGLMEFN